MTLPGFGIPVRLTLFLLPLTIRRSDCKLIGSRIGFATVSNFTMLLLVQAPNAERAVKGKHLVDSWLRVLRTQSLSFSLMKLGLTRLDAMHWVGLGQTFVLPQHVQDIILGSGSL